jgi:hypothetical protein
MLNPLCPLPTSTSRSGHNSSPVHLAWIITVIGDGKGSFGLTRHMTYYQRLLFSTPYIAKASTADIMLDAKSQVMEGQ